MSYGQSIFERIPFLKEIPVLKEQKQPKEQKQILDVKDPCENMVYNSPKVSLVEKSGKDILKGIIAGALLGAAGSEDRSKGAVLGGIAGAVTAMTYKMATTRHLQRESYESAAKRHGYNGGNLLTAEVIVPRREISEGRYAEMILRVSLLTEKKSDVEPISITTYLSFRNTRIPIGKEEYYVELGTTPFVYYFPICSGIKRGEYTIVFEVVGAGIHASTEGSFKVVK
ncbi:MAG: hypothetical protein N2327_02040 [Caldimicrobium sp.]|nr:hypothetical protein [Caldimicrobium sp.]MDW8095087.1 hypothetical protein [Caldimicrobium sp.]